MFDLPKVDTTRLAEVCRRYGVARLAAFGSVSRGEATESSDLDLLYDLEPGRHLTWDIELLAEELGAVLGRPIDLVSRRALHPLIRRSVEAQAEALYAA
jgi:predicted nucleotidyltransferase